MLRIKWRDIKNQGGEGIKNQGGYHEPGGIPRTRGRRYQELGGYPESRGEDIKN